MGVGVRLGGISGIGVISVISVIGVSGISGSCGRLGWVTGVRLHYACIVLIVGDSGSCYNNPIIITTIISYHPILLSIIRYIPSLTLLLTSTTNNNISTLTFPPLLFLLLLLHLHLTLNHIALLPVMVTLLHLLHILIPDIIIPEERVIPLCFLLLFLLLLSSLMQLLNLVF